MWRCCGSFFNFNGTSVNHTHPGPGRPPGERWKEIVIIAGAITGSMILVAIATLCCYRYRRSRKVARALQRKGGRGGRGPETRPLLAAHHMDQDKGGAGGGSSGTLDAEHSQLLLRT